MEDYKGLIISMVVVVLVGATSVFFAPDKQAVDINNLALESLGSGDEKNAIVQFEQAAEETDSPELKRLIYSNLGHAYFADMQDDKALESFKKALTYAEQDTFEYYLTAGEVALREKKPDIAESNYNKAFELRPNDYTVNNALSLFYFDLFGLSYDYYDPKKGMPYAQKAYDSSDELVKSVMRDNLAIAHYLNGNYGLAIDLFLQSNLEATPALGYWLGLAYYSKGDDENAKLYLQRAVDADVAMPPEVAEILAQLNAS